MNQLKSYLNIITDIREWGRRGMHVGYLRENQKERDHWEDQEKVGGQY
jgi:hypothetical protein